MPVTILRANGCRYHDDCFTCPFDDCVASVDAFYAAPAPFAERACNNTEGSSAAVRRRRLRRAEVALARQAEGASVVAIAEELGISQRSVWRILQGAR